MKIILLLIFVICNQAANACSWDTSYIFKHLDAELKKSTAVFKGKVTDIIDTGRLVSANGEDDEIIISKSRTKEYDVIEKLVEVKPTEYFKGIPRTLYLISIGYCNRGHGLKVGEERIFFIKQNESVVYDSLIIEPASDKLLSLLKKKNEK